MAILPPLPPGFFGGILARPDIFIRVTILGWAKHNSSKKKGHKYILLSTRFLDDSAIVSMPVRTRLLYLWMLTRCGDETRDTIEFMPSQCRVATGLKPSEVLSAIRSLEQNQLLSSDFRESLNNRIEKKRKEKKRIERDFDPPPPAQAPLAPKDISTGDGLNSEIWKAYADAYFHRYKTEPVRNAKVNGQISQLARRLGSEAPDVVRFYVGHNKTFYAAKCHEIGLCLSDAEALRTQWAKGKAITNADLKRFERNVENHNLDRLIDEGKI